MEHDDSSSGPKADDALAPIVSHIATLPELAGEGYHPIDEVSIKAARLFVTPRAFHATRTGDEEGGAALAYIAARLADAQEGEAEGPIIRLSIWNAMRNWLGMDSMKQHMVAVAVAWNAVQWERDGLEVKIHGRGRKRTYDRKSMARCAITRDASRGRDAELVPIDEVPPSALARIMGYASADAAAIT